MENKHCFKTLHFEKKDHIVVLTIPGFSGGDDAIDLLSEELANVCAAIGFDEDVRALVITSAQEPAAPGESAAEDPASSGASFQIQDIVAALGFPTIAAITGDAVGFGLELAMACDIRIASETSRFGLPQIHNHLIPSHGGTQRLPRLVGKAKAMEMILTGCLIDAEEALRTALITRVMPASDVTATALDIAREMATKAPVAVRYAKEAIYKGQDMTLDQGLRMENDLYILLFATSDRVEGIQAFKEKRKPVFRGK